jgi:hypothetical protein
MMKVEVAYALPHEQKIMALQVEDGCTAKQAVVRSGIIELFPGIDPDNDPMGIFGKAIKDPATTVLREGDRVEIYRPLIADPKEVRARRAAKMKAQKAAEAEQA